MATILLVEDEPNQRLLYQMELEDEGYQVVASSRIDEELDRSITGKADLAILNPNLKNTPFCDEICALQILKEIAPELPVIIYTGESLYEDDFRYWMADACLVKSSDLGPLKRAVEGVLQRGAVGGRVKEVL